MIGTQVPIAKASDVSLSESSTIADEESMVGCEQAISSSIALYNALAFTLYVYVYTINIYDKRVNICIIRSIYSMHIPSKQPLMQ